MTKKDTSTPKKPERNAKAQSKLQSKLQPKLQSKGQTTKKTDTKTKGQAKSLTINPVKKNPKRTRDTQKNSLNTKPTTTKPAKTTKPTTTKPTTTKPAKATKPPKKPKVKPETKTKDKVAEKTAPKEKKQAKNQRDTPKNSATTKAHQKPSPLNPNTSSNPLTPPPLAQQNIATKTSEKPVSKTRLEKAQLKFKIDDYVFYPSEGVGRIADIEERVFQDKKLLYYVVEFTSLTMRSRFPVDKVNTLQVRPVVSTNIARKALDCLLDPLDTESVSWKDRLQIQHDIIKVGEIRQCAQMLAALYVRRQKKPLSFQERQSYDFALESLRDELSVVLLKDKIEIQNKILTILKHHDIEEVLPKKRTRGATKNTSNTKDSEDSTTEPIDTTTKKRRKKGSPEGGENLDETEVTSMNTLDDTLSEEAHDQDWV